MKSHESDLLELHRYIYNDSCGLCTANVSDLRDLETIESRVKNEGISFLTITLPDFCSDFQQSLAIGRIDPTFFRSFRKNGAIPAFLQGMLGLIFDRETGRIRDEVVSEEFSPQTYCSPRDRASIVGCVRSICLAFKKLGLACTPEREAAAIEGFISSERDLEDHRVQEEDLAHFSAVSSIIWPSIVSPIRADKLEPKHGPGVTAERISGNLKWRWVRWHERLESNFPFLGFGLPLGASLEEEFDSVTFVSPEHEQPVRVVTVPKTSKSPRVIAIEPVCMQYAQQAIRGELYTRIENSRWTGGRINFRDQSINRAIALEASIDGSMATIDLKEASDRVPRDLALSMFQSNPSLMEAIDACRSKSAELPSGSVIELRKFASMGSALCFPVESMYFYTICIVALLRFHNLPVTSNNVKLQCSKVFVYGDDIIVPADAAVSVIDHLQKYSCKVNVRKSYWHGKFRESCGQDAFMGYDVTPTYIRSLRPSHRRQVSEIISSVKTANLFYQKGFFQTSEFLFKGVERILGKLPYVSENSPALGRNPLVNSYSFGRWNKKLHRVEVNAWVVEPVYYTDPLDGYAALGKSLSLLTSREREVRQIDPLHLRRSASYGETTLKRRWVPPT